MIGLATFVLAVDFAPGVRDFDSNASFFKEALEESYSDFGPKEIKEMIISESGHPYKIRLLGNIADIEGVEIVESGPSKWNSNKVLKLVATRDVNGVAQFKWTEICQ